MRRSRGLWIGQLGLGSCLLAGCLRVTVPPESQRPRVEVSSSSAPIHAPSTDYLVSRTPADPPPQPQQLASAKTLESPADKPNEKPVEPVDMRIEPEQSPRQPPDPPPHVEVQPAALARLDAPSVQVLRGLLDRRPEEEINEQLKTYDPVTREALLVMMGSIVQLEQGGGIERIPPRDLAAWTNRLNTLTASLRSRSQLILERSCFCNRINNFGDFVLLPAEHSFFYPGELAHVYVQARNLSCRRRGDKYATVLKARLEVYDENSRLNPSITWGPMLREDISASPRQDYYINFRFLVRCPPGLYTLRITLEDWTDAPPGAKEVPESRMAHCTLDFRVSGLIARPARNRVAEAASQP